MLAESTKPEAKAAAENVQETQQKTVLMTAQLVQAILEKITNKSSLEKDSTVKNKKPATLEIAVDGQVAYRGKEGEEPTINNLNAEQIKTLKVNQVKEKTREKAARQKDLQGVKVLMTTRQLLAEFGGEGKTQQFSANNYRFSQSEAGVSITGNQGQTLFNYDAKQGRITDNNLRSQDLKFMSEIKQELTQYQSMKSEKSGSKSREQLREAVELGA